MTGRQPAHRETLEALARAVRLEASALSRRPELTWQQLANRLQWAGPAADDVLRSALARRSEAWLRLRTRPAESGLVRVVDAGNDWITTCALSADGATAVSAAADGTVALWDVVQGRLIRELGDLSGGANGCALSADGTLVAVTAADGHLYLWDAFDGSLLDRAEAHERSANACAFTPDGQSVITGGSDGTIARWSFAPLAEVWRTSVGTPVTTCVAGLADSRVAGGGLDCTVRILRADGRELASLEHPATVRACSAGSGGTLLAVGCEDGSVTVWRIADRFRVSRLQAGHQPVNDCALWRDGRLLATASGDGIIRLWAVEGGAPAGVLRGHDGEVVGCSLSEDGRRLVSAGEDGTLKVWAPDAAVEASRPDHEGVVWACAFTPAGDLVLSAGSEGRLLAWDVEAPTARELGRHDGVVADCAVSDDGRFAASAGEDGVVGLYNLSGAAPPRRLCGHQSAVSVCVFCGSLLITGDRDGTCRTWSLPDGDRRSILEERAGQVWECAVPGDHSYVACAHDGGRVTVWDLPDGTLRHRFREQDGVVWTCAVSDDGRLVASGGHDGLIRVHDARDGSKVQVLRGHEGHVLRCRFAAPAGLLSSGADGTVRLWDLGAGREKTMLRLHQAAVRTFAVSPSGRFLVSGGQDGLIQVTDLIAERVVCTLPLASRIWSLALHPHHAIFACGGSGGVFHLVELVGSESQW